MFTNRYCVKRRDNVAEFGRRRSAGLLFGTICLIASTTISGCGSGKSQPSEKTSEKMPYETGRAETPPSTYGDMTVQASGVTDNPASVAANGREFIGLQGGRYDSIVRELRLSLQAKEYILFSKGDELFTISPSGTGLTNRTNTPGANELWGDWVGANGKIAFIKIGATPVIVDRGWDIFTMNLDGSAITNITNSTQDEYDASATPNGVIAFTKNTYAGSSNAFDLYTIKHDGTNLAQITATASVSEFGPNGSSNGAKIAFHRFNASTGNADIFIANANGTGEVNITNTPNVNEQSPALSPDGTKVLFQRMSGTNSDIVVANANGSNLVNITNTPNEREINADWSPNGARIVYARGTVGTGISYDLYVMNADGSGAVNITNTPTESETNPRWSPTIYPFVRYVGPGGLLGNIASGTIFAQEKGNTTGVVAFDINNSSPVARANVRVTAKLSGSQVIYTLGFTKPTSDSFISLKYLNGEDKPITVIGTGSGVSKASGASIVFNALSGTVVNVTPTGNL